MQLLLFSLLVAGITYVITQSLIARPLRKAVSSLGGFWAHLIYCPPCTGFWVGAALGLTPLWTTILVGLELTPRWLCVLGGGYVGVAVMALWKEWGPQQDTWALDQGSSDDNSSEEENEQAE